ncbi:uncharacterized protein LOC111346735 [Stylophora pistillata]|uniref:Uncharacterized protein n=1 Tax=Stylophora pistillata TaxID=50429 RepID=A0A2B4SB67_STYPI|nr:uncharacterized protein LOC111326976 [Stylophora pistillata]XP_022809744.1 uncharacterized protein LOC111346735 [Stylophora pistillata]PFX12842.1 hypothetical protein AWC38_SpisGene23133 [Stylophora pistillata]PFX27924.1 hypothetical protein AWC38_SpisGene7383 [Stylophora pistillata]
MGNSFSVDNFRDGYTKLKNWLVKCLTEAKAALKRIFERAIAGIQWLWKGVLSAVEFLGLRKRRAEAACGADGQEVPEETSEESELRAPVQEESNQVTAETDQVSVKSNLLTEEEEVREEQCLLFMENAADTMKNYANSYRQMKEEHRQHGNNEILARKLDRLNRDPAVKNAIMLAKNFLHGQNRIPENVCL